MCSSTPSHGLIFHAKPAFCMFHGGAHLSQRDNAAAARSPSGWLAGGEAHTNALPTILHISGLPTMRAEREGKEVDRKRDTPSICSSDGSGAMLEPRSRRAHRLHAVQRYGGLCMTFLFAVLNTIIFLDLVHCF
jgi:hypothetical protein